MGIDDLIFNVSSSNKVASHDPIDIFNYLDKKDGYGYLRTNQADFLKEWHLRRNERDIVGIMHTGAGKTLVGLLMLQSKLIEEEKPVIYLCPTRQLVEQTVQQARNYGINVCEIDQSNRLPIEFQNAEKILVTTFSRLFNGRSIFGVKDFSNTSNVVDLGSILIDDAHASVDYARNSSTISIPRDSSAYNSLLDLFATELKRQSYGKYNAILSNSERSVSVQVPYWSWLDNIDVVKEILGDFCKEEQNTDFEYRMIVNILDFSRCYISGEKIEITPKYNPMEQIPSFFKAAHRYILSATINEKDLREELGIEPEAIETPIITKSYTADIGERMILSPTTYHKDLTDGTIRKWIFEQCKSNDLGLVVITPSNHSPATREWGELGATILNNSNFESELSDIREGLKKQIVLVNRYEGVDFPGNQSNILILDGLPEYYTNKDKAVSITSEDDNWRMKIVQKIEQGMGRTVRSNSDYSVVLLLGDSLINFVSLKSNLKYFSLATQSQLNISKELVAHNRFETFEQAAEEVLKSINYCLERNNHWVQFAKMRLNEVDVKVMLNKDISKIENEYNAYKKYMMKDFRGAIEKLDILENSEGSDEKGRIFQEKAEIKYFAGEVTNAQNLQKLAYEHWDYAFTPQILGYRKKVKNLDIIANSMDFITGFDDKNSLKNALDNIIKNLMYDNNSSSELFEEAVENLGKLLGLHSIRPEKIKNDGGPDNLWLSRDFRFVIECKNREINKIDKDDIKQLGHSGQWFVNNYGESNRYKLLLFHQSSDKENNVQTSENMFVIPKDKLFKLKDSIEQLKQLLYSEFENLTKEKLQDYLVRTKLNLGQFEQEFFVKL